MSDGKFSHKANIELVQNMVAGALAKALADLPSPGVKRGERVGFIVKRLDSAIVQAMDAIALTSEPMISGPAHDHPTTSLGNFFDAEFGVGSDE